MKRAVIRRRNRATVFRDLPVGARFSFPKTGTVGRRAVHTKVSGRKYSPRVGDVRVLKSDKTVVDPV